jgi:hypothetical protein
MMSLNPPLPRDLNRELRELEFERVHKAAALTMGRL